MRKQQNIGLNKSTNCRPLDTKKGMIFSTRKKRNKNGIVLTRIYCIQNNMHTNGQYTPKGNIKNMLCTISQYRKGYLTQFLTD